MCDGPACALPSRRHYWTQKQLQLFPLLLPFFLITVPCSNQPCWSWVLFPDLGQGTQNVPPICPPNELTCGAVLLTTPLPRGQL